MLYFRSNPALYKLVVDEKLEGVSGGYADEFIRTGYAKFRNLCSKTHESLQIGAIKTLPCEFTGLSLDRYHDGIILMH